MLLHASFPTFLHSSLEFFDRLASNRISMSQSFALRVGIEFEVQRGIVFDGL
jgi:hypothetical protein